MVLIRDVGGLNRLKAGEKAGNTKLRGTIKGPFRYRAQTSPRYCEVEDADGNTWDKAYDDVIPYDSTKPVNTYKIKDFLSTSTALAKERAYRGAAGKRKPQQKEEDSHTKRQRARTEKDSEEEEY